LGAHTGTAGTKPFRLIPVWHFETLSVTYEFYVERGNESGLELDDWLRTEERLCGAMNKRSPKAM
jgi:hypothetical protein